LHGKLQLRERMLPLGGAGFRPGQSVHARQKHRARIARRELERGVEPLVRPRSQQDDSIFRRSARPA